jgi:hypothetical protein
MPNRKPTSARWTAAARITNNVRTRMSTYIMNWRCLRYGTYANQPSAKISDVWSTYGLHPVGDLTRKLGSPRFGAFAITMRAAFPIRNEGVGRSIPPGQSSAPLVRTCTFISFNRFENEQKNPKKDCCGGTPNTVTAANDQRATDSNAPLS